ncbi:MAG: SusC/RagA family TonB-linked outer membrane protein [Chryseobacterium sp.]|nr:SusC/RagA family TonB-linked outer membrane protein [Chryseobacterium sp.]
MRNYNVLKIAPAFLLLGSMLHAQQSDTAKKETEIEQVVLIGYGAKKKSDLTGSVTALTDKDFNKGAIVSTQQLLQGKAAGVTISNDGAPGGGASVTIRGISSISGNTDPLYVIDGVAITRESTGGVGNPLNLVNPNDIESISVLKDASATAIYGVRASAGVIIVKTKSGSQGKWKYNYSGNVQLNTTMDTYDVFSASQLTDIVKNRLPGKYDLLGIKDASGNQVLYDTDWQKEIYQKAWGTAQDFSARGNAFKGKLPMRLSIGYNNNDGILKTSNFERMNASINLTPKLLNDNLLVTINAKGTKTKYRYADTGAVGQAIAMDPTKPVTSDLPLYQNYGSYVQWLQEYPVGGNTYVSTPQNVGLGNPVATLEGKRNIADVKQFLGSSEFEYKFPFLKGLSAVANLGLEYVESETTNDNQAYLTAMNTSTGAQIPYADISNQVRNNQSLDLYLKYSKSDFNSGIISDLGFTGGYSYQSFRNAGDSSKYLYDPSQYSYSYYRDKGVLVSFFGRGNISFVDKYLLTLTVRHEASSRFNNSEYRWATSPSAAFAWQMKKEDWLKDSNFFSDMKLRLGWGITGNQDLGNNWYPTLAYYNTVNSSLANFVVYANGINQAPIFVNTINPNAYNSQLKWEKTAQYNMGLDFGILRRVTGSIDYWRKDIQDLLYYAFLPAGANYNSKINGNFAEIKSQGIDLDLNFKIVNKAKTKFDIGINMGWVDMKTTKVNVDGSIDATSFGGLSGLTQNPNVQAMSVDRIPFEFYLYKQAYDTSGRPLEGVFVDMNGDGKITPDDRYLTGKSGIPDVTFGWNTFLQVGNFDLRTVWRASVGNYAFNNINARYSTLKYIDSDGFGAVNNTVTNYNNTGFVNAPGSFQFISDLYLENASFVKLDNVTVGYVFDNFLNTKTRFRFYGSVQNVFTITKYSGLDPEVGTDRSKLGVDWNLYPRSRVFTFGVNVDF